MNVKREKMVNPLSLCLSFSYYVYTISIIYVQIIFTKKKESKILNWSLKEL